MPRRFLFALLSLVALAQGCAVNRPALSSDKLIQRKAAQLGYITQYARIVEDRLVRRMAHEAAATPDRQAVIDILIISGGGDFGAFGAGFLQGWGWNVTPASDLQKRPEFDIVTGVSTGALIAPYAFIGTSPEYDRVADLYSAPKKEWFVSRGLLKLLFGAESYMDTSGLRAELDNQITSETISAIAQGEREHRSLWIGTTNLDLGVLYPWDLTLEARGIVEAPPSVEQTSGSAEANRIAEPVGAHGARASRFRDVLLASASIPAVFPPVVIDDTLYVDGGTTSNILFDVDLLQPGGPVERFRKDNPSLRLPRFRYWIIINNKIGADGHIVQPTWLSITKASVATAIRSSTLGSLKHLEALTELQRCKGIDSEFRFVCIPDDWQPPVESPEPFDPALMNSLLDLGRQMGERWESWRTDLSANITD
ncbi:MAG: patatin-like phospholipase family protein [Tepidisphaera sp.]